MSLLTSTMAAALVLAIMFASDFSNCHVVGLQRSLLQEEAAAEEAAPAVATDKDAALGMEIIPDKEVPTNSEEPTYELIGNRIPYEFFVTTGAGESDAGSEGLPFETGSFDASLHDAGIMNQNIVEYTSVIPVGATEIPKEDGLARLQWGEVLECIKASMNGKKGERISAAICTTDVYDIASGDYLGAFATEYAGSMTKTEVEESLAFSIQGMMLRRGYGNITNEMYATSETEIGFRIEAGKSIFAYVEIEEIKQEYGTVMANICFVSFKVPQL